MPTYVDTMHEGRTALNRRLVSLEAKVDADVLGLWGAIRPGLDNLVRDALESLSANRKERLAVVIFSGGGIVEVCERIVTTTRHFYPHVAVYVPDIALSAATILAMSADQIWMDYSSVLGPIDPQLERNGTFVPALSYLSQYDRMIAKSAAGTLTNAEFLILKGFDQAELHQYEKARDLSVSLLKRWLANYKFRDWTITQTRRMPVTQEMREKRAEEVATALMDHQRWGSHGRGIGMQVLVEELKLQIDDFGPVPDLARDLRDYATLAGDVAAKLGLKSLVHARDFL